MRLPVQLSRRKPNSHKGSFGHIFVLAGSSEFSGAAILTSYAALRAGAGIVTLGIPEGINSAIIEIKPPEIITKPLAETSQGSVSYQAFSRIKKMIKDVDIFVIGPGLTQNKSTQHLIRELIKVSNKPTIIDADGLNALVGHLDILQMLDVGRPTFVLTPHPGEMARLIGKTTAFVQKNRKPVAKQFAHEYNSIIVLKGHRTLIVKTNGKVYINKTGNPGMATAGSGDVLTGIIAAFLAQGLDAFNASKYAVYIHGLAGDLAIKNKTELSLIASDIIEYIPKAIKKSMPA